ncbi:hypothetical protein QYM36_009917 [Artemia franciscana]|uniref:Non-specific serine/threonine protein kinase n=1 Tax=Artemia franciscana TaxID=6661 RepID=A0AA88HNI2_ARTSF|nr:hypothetical protein QYM36_009917 [Artemia franciscana]
MERRLSSLKDACNACESNKISERKKAADVVKSQLENDQVLRALDQNSDSDENDRLFGWDMVFQAGVKYVLKELEKIEKDVAKNPERESTQGPSDSSKLFCSSFIRFITRKGNSRGPRIPVLSLIDHVLFIMINPLTRRIFGKVYITIIESDILAYRQNWISLDKEIWESLLSCTVKYHNEQPASSDHSSSLRLMASIIHLGNIGHNLSEFLLEKRSLMVDLKSSLNSIVEQNEALVLLSVYCDALEFYDRVQVCEFGERYLSAVIGAWDEHNEKTSNDIVNIIEKQLKYHHPKNSFETEMGAFSVCDWSDWKEQLKKLHKFIDNIVTSLIKTKRCYCIHPGLIGIASKLLYLLMKLHVTDIEITDIGTQMSSVRKKRKLASSFQDLLEEIKIRGPVDAAVPWLEIFNKFLEDFGDTCSSTELGEVYSILATHIISCRQTSVLKYLVRTFRTLLKASVKVSNFQIPKDEVKKVWELCMKALSLNQCEEEADSLLHEILCLQILPKASARLLPDDLVHGRLNILKAPLGFISYLANYNIDLSSTSITNNCSDDCELFAQIPHKNKVAVIAAIITGLDSDTSLGYKFPLNTLLDSLLLLCLKNYTPTFIARDKLSFSEIEEYYMQVTLLECISPLYEREDNIQEKKTFKSVPCISKFALKQLISLCHSVRGKLPSYENVESRLSAVVMLTALTAIYVEARKRLQIDENMLGNVRMGLLSSSIEDGILRLLKEVQVKPKQKMLVLDNLKEIFAFSSNLSALISDRFTNEIFTTFFSAPSSLLTMTQQLETTFLHSFRNGASFRLNSTQNIDWCPIETDENDTMSVDKFESKNFVESESFQLRLSAFIAEIILFDEEKSDNFLNILQSQDFRNGVVVNIVFEVLDVFTNKPPGTLNNKTVESLLYTLQPIAQHHYSDTKIMSHLLRVICNLMKHLNDNGDRYLLETCVDLMKPFTNLLTNGTLGMETAVYFVTCVAKFQNLDFKCDVDIEIDGVSLLTLFDICSNYNAKLMWYTFRALSNVYFSGCNVRKRTELEKSMLNRFCAFDLSEILGFQEDFSKTARSSVALQLLVSWVFSFKWTSFNCFNKLVTLSVDPRLTKFSAKTVFLWCASKNLQIFTVTESWMYNCLFTFFESNHDATNFPYKIFGFRDFNFFIQDCLSKIVGAFVSCKGFSNLSDLCRMLNYQREQLVAEGFPGLISVLLCKSDFMKHVTTLKNEITSDRFESLCRLHFKDIALCLINLAYDLQYLKELVREDVTLVDFHGSIETVKVYQAFDVLPQLVNKKDSTVLYLVKEDMLVFHEILINIVHSVSSSYLSVQKIQSLVQLSLLIDITMNVITNCDELCVYFATIVIEAVTRFTKHPELCTMSLNMIKNFVQIIVGIDPKILAESKISRLVPILYELQGNALLKDLARYILEILLNRNLVPRIIDTDDSSGNSEQGALERSLSVMSIIENFIRKMESNAFEASYLKTLIQFFRNDRKELIEIVKNEEHLLSKMVSLLLSIEGKENSDDIQSLLQEIPFNSMTVLSLVEKDQRNDSTTILLHHLAVSCLSEKPEIAELSNIVLKNLVDKQEFQGYFTDDCHDRWLSQFFKPFTYYKFKTSQSCKLHNEELSLVLNDTGIWQCKYQFENWISRLVCGILRAVDGSSIVVAFLPLCEASSATCVLLFPFCMELLLQVSTLKPILNGKFLALVDYLSSNLRDDLKLYVCQILNLVESLRMKSLEAADKNASPYFDYFFLNWDYLKLSQLASFANRDFLAVNYMEVGMSSLARHRKTGEADIQRSTFECKYGLVSNKKQIDDIISKSFDNLGSIDDAIAFKEPGLPDIESKTACTTAKSFGGNVIDHLKNTKSFSLLMPLLKDDDSTYRYQCAWRLGNWDLPTDDTNFDNAVYSTFSSVRLRDTDELEYRLRKLRGIFSSRNAATKELSLNKILPRWVELEIIKEFENVKSWLSNDQNEEVLLQKLREESEFFNNDNTTSIAYTHVEQILSVRSVIAEEVCKSSATGRSLHLLHSDIAAKYNDSNSSLRFLQMAANCSSIESVSVQPRNAENCEISLRKANVLWAKGERSTALKLIEPVVLAVKSKEVEVGRLFIDVLLTQAKWLKSSQRESPSSIITECLTPALEEAELTGNPEDMAKCIIEMAEYTSRVYDSSAKSLNSEEVQRKKRIMNARQEDWQKIQEQMRQTRKDTSEYKTLYNKSYWINKENQADQHELDELLRKKKKFALESVRYYVEYFKIAPITHSKSAIYRLISIWLNNSGYDDLCQELARSLANIPSHKFILLMPQLTARCVLNPTDGISAGFVNGILGLVERCAKDHPHHVIPFLLALQMSSIPTKNDPERIMAAKQIITKLKQSRVRNIIGKMEVLYNHLIELSNLPTKLSSLPRNHPLLSLRGFEILPPLTANLKINPSGQYNSLIGINSYSSRIDNVGGMNAPKRLEVIDTEGKRRYELLKGNDDTRQDAVMEQVFTFVNSCLEQNREARERRLKIRTYKVVPLSSQSGVIEWVNNTQMMGDWLQSAHPLYYPKDLAQSQAMEKMKNVAKAEQSVRISTFKSICQKMRPVFHYYFFEKFHFAPEWLEKRLSYTRSVAASSMVGYILGIGDRHTSNILIDNASAEVVHIDFGYAFDQGLLLPTPEQVPFRLTRDVVDGMGVCGVEGTFRKCCEITMSILRENYLGILTLLEVLLFDPVYLWEMTPNKALVVATKRRSRDDETQRTEIHEQG